MTKGKEAISAKRINCSEQKQFQFRTSLQKGAGGGAKCNILSSEQKWGCNEAAACIFEIHDDYDLIRTWLLRVTKLMG